MTSDFVGAQMQIGQAVQWTGKVPPGTVSMLDQEWFLGVVGSRIQ